MSRLTQKRLKELLHYNPEDGTFIWLKPPKRKPYLFRKPAGTFRPNSYIYIKVEGRLYGAHRLAFLWMTGKWPQKEVDHINRDPSDNRWENLREATPSQNKMNVDLQSNNRSHHKGVHWYKRDKKWYARITKNGEKKHLGCFESLDEAVAARHKAESELFGEYAA